MDINPYLPPCVEIREPAQGGYATVRIFSFQGRLGRVRYILYSIGMFLLIYLLMAMYFATMELVPESARGMGAMLGLVVGYAALLIIGFILTIQRCHDFDTTGWLSLLLLIPLVPVIFWFIPGTRGENSYGPPPPPNSGTGLVLTAVLIILVVIAAILAAIAVPAYQDYVERARQAQMPSE